MQDKVAANARSLVNSMCTTERGHKKNSLHKRALVNVLSRDLPPQEAADILGIDRGYVYHSRKGDLEIMKAKLLKARYPAQTSRVKVGKFERARIAAFVEDQTFTPSGSATARKVLEEFQWAVYSAYRTDYVAQLKLMVSEGFQVRTKVLRGKKKPNIIEMNVMALQLSEQDEHPISVASVGEGWRELKLSSSDEALRQWKLRPRDKDTFWAIAKEEVSFVRSKKSSHCHICDHAAGRILELQDLEGQIHATEQSDDHSELPKLKQKRRILRNKVERDKRHARMLQKARVKAKDRENALRVGEVMVIEDFGALYKLDGSKAVNLIFTLIYRTEEGGPLHIRYIDNWCTNKGHYSEVCIYYPHIAAVIQLYCYIVNITMCMCVGCGICCGRVESSLDGIR
jgi:hypothetical protein